MITVRGSNAASAWHVKPWIGSRKGASHGNIRDEVQIQRKLLKTWLLRVGLLILSLYSRLDHYRGAGVRRAVMIGRFSRLLVVDGNVASRSATNNVLRGLGHESIDFAPDSATAIRMIGNQNYRLIVADWDMTSVNGGDILRQVRLDKRHKALPFLMGIDRWQRKFIEVVREDGAILYVIKPFVAEILAERILQVSRDADQIGLAEVVRSPSQRAAMREPTTIPKLWQLLRPES